MLSQEQMSKFADEVTRLAAKTFPEAELYELGAFFTSTGIFLVAQAVPELWPSLKPAAVISHQLLNQADAKARTENDRTPPTDRQEDRRGIGEASE